MVGAIVALSESMARALSLLFFLGFFTFGSFWASAECQAKNRKATARKIYEILAVNRIFKAINDFKGQLLFQVITKTAYAMEVAVI